MLRLKDIILFKLPNGESTVNLLSILLTPSREADRCVKILENLSLRGNFWPGACLATIKDLQQALMNNIANDNSDPQGPSPRRRLHDLQKQQRQGTAQTTQALTINPSSTSVPQHNRNNIRPIDLSKDSQFNQATPSTIVSTPLAIPSSQMNPSSFLRTHPMSSFPPNGVAAYSDIWAGGMNSSSFYSMETPPTGSMDTPVVGFDDIFQLMDASYHLSEHMHEAPDMGS